MNRKKYPIVSFLAAMLAAAIVSLAISWTLRHIGTGSMILKHYLQIGAVLAWWIPITTLFADSGWIDGEWIISVGRSVRDIPERLWLPAMIFIVFVTTASIAFWGYRAVPKTGDEVSLLFQAKIFSSGRWFATQPLLREIFHLETTIFKDNRWFSMYQPGHPLLLALGVLAGCPWVIGPVLSALTAAVTYKIGQMLYGEIVAKLGTFLLFTSPFYLLSGGTYTVHNTSLLALTVASWMFIKWHREQRSYYLLFAGIGIGFGFITRAYTTAAFLFPFLIWGALGLVRRRPIFTGILFFAAGAIPFLVFQLWNNALLTNNPFVFPYQLFHVRGYNNIGFGTSVGGALYGSPGHTPLKGLVNFGYNLLVLSLHLHGWPFLSLVPMVALLCTRLCRAHLLLLSLIACFAGANFLVWYNGIGFWGPRYYTELLPYLALLTAAGIVQIQNAFKHNLRMSRVFPVVIMLLIAGSVLVYLPCEWHFMRNTDWGCRPLPKPPLEPSLVLVTNQPESLPGATFANMFIFPAAFNYNSPDLNDKTIFGQSLSDVTISDIAAAYPDRTFFLLRRQGSTWVYQPVPRP